MHCSVSDPSHFNLYNSHISILYHSPQDCVQLLEPVVCSRCSSPGFLDQIKGGDDSPEKDKSTFRIRFSDKSLLPYSLPLLQLTRVSLFDGHPFPSPMHSGKPGGQVSIRDLLMIKIEQKFCQISRFKISRRKCWQRLWTSLNVRERDSWNMTTRPPEITTVQRPECKQLLSDCVQTWLLHGPHERNSFLNFWIDYSNLNYM